MNTLSAIRRVIKTKISSYHFSCCVRVGSCRVSVSDGWHRR